MHGEIIKINFNIRQYTPLICIRSQIWTTNKHTNTHSNKHRICAPKYKTVKISDGAKKKFNLLKKFRIYISHKLSQSRRKKNYRTS
jgi:hypothetical protein